MRTHSNIMLYINISIPIKRVNAFNVFTAVDFILNHYNQMVSVLHDRVIVLVINMHGLQSHNIHTVAIGTRTSHLHADRIDF